MLLMDNNWEGNTESFVEKCNNFIIESSLDEAKQVLSVRLVRDYVARGILTKPKRSGKEVLFGYIQFIQMLACRSLLRDGWSLKMIAGQFKNSSIEEIESLISESNEENDSMKLIKLFTTNHRWTGGSHRQPKKAVEKCRM